MDYSVWAGYCVSIMIMGSLGTIMFNNDIERAFVLVMPMCGFALLWMTVKDAALAD